MVLPVEGDRDLTVDVRGVRAEQARGMPLPLAALGEPVRALLHRRRAVLGRETPAEVPVEVPAG